MTKTFELGRAFFAAVIVSWLVAAQNKGGALLIAPALANISPAAAPAPESARFAPRAPLAS